MKPFFHPNDNNLGGKKIIATHKSNHILSILNASPLVNSLKSPHPHVNGTQRNKKKNIEMHDYYREVEEAHKKILNVKHGYVNHSKPKTFHLRNCISRRQVYEKNIILHDHLRNIAHLGNSLRNINKVYEKRGENIKSNASLLKNNQSFNKKNSRTQSMDFFTSGNVMENYNPFCTTNRFYDSSDFPAIDSERIIGGLEEKKFDLKEKDSLKSQRTIGLDEVHDFLGNKEDLNNDLLKKRLIEFIVKKKVYRKSEILDLQKEVLKSKNLKQENKEIESIFNDIMQYFYK